MRKVDITTVEGKVLWESYIELTKALADVVRDGPLEDKGYPNNPIVATIKIWPAKSLSFQIQVTKEGKCELWQLEDMEL